MIWENPVYLWLLLLIPVLIAASIYMRQRIKKLRQGYFSEHLFKELHSNRWDAGARAKSILLYIGMAFLVLALAGPKIGTEVREIKRQGIDLMIALDISRSMLTEDVRPNRLEKAKFEILRMIDQLQGDRVGLIVFTGHAFLQSPLTTDYSAFRMYLDIADTDQMPSGTTNFSEAIREAHVVFQAEREREREGNAARVLLLISDGEDHGPDFTQQLNQLAAQDVIIYTVGIGTRQGGMIPSIDPRSGRQTGFHRDREGNIVTSRLEPATLQQIARAGNGLYYEIQRGSDRLDGFLSQLSDLERRDFATEQFSDYKNQYQIVGLFGLVFLVVAIALPRHKTQKSII
ncbi:MAG: VWA domain-containing protein [Balneolaceae bacterium]|nr:MAG: VWA domain-containing protein [Balneolaceae bacterium]